MSCEWLRVLWGLSAADEALLFTPAVSVASGGSWWKSPNTQVTRGAEPRPNTSARGQRSGTRGRAGGPAGSPPPPPEAPPASLLPVAVRSRAFALLLAVAQGGVAPTSHVMGAWD